MDTDSQCVMRDGAFTHRVNTGLFINHSLSVLIRLNCGIKAQVSGTQQTGDWHEKARPLLPVGNPVLGFSGIVAMVWES